MSLTNDMLNNLAKRHLSNKDSEFLLNGVEATASNKLYYVTYFFYIIAAFILFGAPIGVYYFTSYYLQTHSAHPTSITFKIPNASFPAKPKIMPQSAPIQIAPAKTETPKPVQVEPIKTSVQEPVQDQVIQQYQEALALIAQNQTSAATEKLKNIINMVPNYQDARATLATVYLENNEVGRATQLLTDGLAISPNNFPLTLLFARSLAMQGRNQAALLALDNIANIAGNNSTYIDLLASIQESLGHYSDAISLYKTLLHDNPTNVRWLIGLGVALEHVGQNDAALSAYQKANAIGQLPPDLQNYVTRHIHALGG